MIKFDDESFLKFLINFIFLPIIIIMIYPATTILIVLSNLKLLELGQLGDFIGGLIGTIIGIITLILLWFNLKLFRAQTNAIKQQVTIMNTSSMIEALSNYISAENEIIKRENHPEYKIENHKLQIARNIRKFLTEELMVTDQYIGYDKPKLAFRKDLMIGTTIYESNKMKIYLVLYNMVPLLTNPLVIEGWDIRPINLIENYPTEFILYIPTEYADKDFIVTIHMISKYSKKVWNQKIKRENGAFFTYEPKEVI